jgi:hypothetical protein
MASGTIIPGPDSQESTLRACMTTLQRMADYHLPATVDRRLLWLSENKELLTAAEWDELRALVDWTEERSREKLEAQIVLRCIATHWPELTPSAP